jgi:hypothetical protein
MILLRIKLTSSRTSPMEQTKMLEISDDIAQKLSLLTFEMADPVQDLSVQQPGYGPTTFTCFPKLALELRLIIWRAAFPRGRKVKTEAQCVFYDYYGPPLPLTLMINRESREETLRHYLLYYQDDELLNRASFLAHHLRSTRNSQKGPRPICYNPCRDLLFLPASFLGDDNTCALLNLIAEKCRPLGKVRILALDDFHSICGLEPVEELNFMLSVIRTFFDPEQICCAHCQKSDEEHKPEAIEILHRAFDLEREKFPGLSIPKISFCNSLQDLEKKMLGHGWQS